MHFYLTDLFNNDSASRVESLFEALKVFMSNLEWNPISPDGDTLRSVRNARMVQNVQRRAPQKVQKDTLLIKWVWGFDAELNKLIVASEKRALPPYQILDACMLGFVLALVQCRARAFGYW